MKLHFPMSKHNRRRAIRLLGKIILALLVGLLWFKSMRLVVLAKALNMRAQNLKQEALSLTESKDISASLAQLRAHVNDLHGLVIETKTTLWPFDEVLKRTGWVPVVGHDMAAIPHLIDMADSMLAAVHDLDEAYSPLIEHMIDDRQRQGSVLDIAQEGLQSGKSGLAQARVDINAAHNARQQIADPDTLNPKLKDILQTTDKLLDMLDKAITAAEAAPALLGTDKSHHVLILIENADELRASGGFITASAYFVIDHGHLSDPVVIGSNNSQIDNAGLQYEEPPLPFSKYMHLQRWHFRDANWWADFPVSATKAAGLYTAGLGVPVDTVVAINQYTVRDLIWAIGPITLSDGSVINQDNTIEALQDLWTTGPGEAGTDARKEFIRKLAPLLLQKLLTTTDRATFLKVWQAQQAMTSRHDLLIYSTDPTIQALSEHMRWDGSIPASKGDYLYVLDTNVGWNKDDLVMDREMHYRVNLTRLTAPTAELDMRYHHPRRGIFIGPACQTGRRYPIKYPQRADDCYADFIRLYVPYGTEFVNSPTFDYPASYVGLPDPKDAHFSSLPAERNKAVFGGLMVLMPGHKTLLSFSYLLQPNEIFSATSDGRLVYQLTIQKQPGRQTFPVTVRVELPENVPVTRVEPEPSTKENNTLIFEMMADSDINIQIVMQPGTQVSQQLGLNVASDLTSEPFPRIIPTSVPLPTIPPMTSTPDALPTDTPGVS